MVYGTYNEHVTGTYKPTNITGGPHIVATNSRLPPIVSYAASFWKSTDIVNLHWDRIVTICLVAYPT